MSHSYGKATVNSLGRPISWVGPYVGCGGVSGNLQGCSTSVSQVDGVSDMAPTCWLSGSVGGGFRKGTMASAYLSVWDKAVLHLLP